MNTNSNVIKEIRPQFTNSAVINKAINKCIDNITELEESIRKEERELWSLIKTAKVNKIFNE